jgi:hypothetical protein
MGPGFVIFRNFAAITERREPNPANEWKNLLNPISTEKPWPL